jgi:hypothetical protein
MERWTPEAAPEAQLRLPLGAVQQMKVVAEALRMARL